MNCRRHWNSHQRHKFLRAEASRDILKFRVLEMPFPGVFKRYFPLQTPCCFIRKHERLGTAIEMSQVFHDIALFERVTPCLNMHSKSFKTGKRMLYNFISQCLFFVSSYGRRRQKQPAQGSQLAGGFGRLPALIDSSALFLHRL